MVRRSLLVDAAAAVALSVLVQSQVWLGDSPNPDERFELPGASAPLLLVATLALTWRRIQPLRVAMVFALCVLAQAVVTWDFASSPGLFFAALLVLYAAGAHASLRDGLIALALVMTALIGRDAIGTPATELDIWNAAFFHAVLLLGFGAGVAVRSRREAAALERERVEREQAIAEERMRIARELHDLVAHSVSATVVQAEAAEEVLAREPDRARDSLQRIQGASREALGEMRRLLGIMREGNGVLAPAHGIADLERLVAETQLDGLSVSLELDAPREGLPPAVELSAFRVVQEALTNVRRHAGRPMHARVSVRREGGALTVEVADDGKGRAADSSDGHGLLGMRERASLFGGEFSAGPRDTGGFVVRASFPL